MTNIPANHPMAAIAANFRPATPWYENWPMLAPMYWLERGSPDELTCHSREFHRNPDWFRPLANVVVYPHTEHRDPPNAASEAADYCNAKTVGDFAEFALHWAEGFVNGDTWEESTWGDPNMLCDLAEYAMPDGLCRDTRRIIELVGKLLAACPDPDADETLEAEFGRAIADDVAALRQLCAA